MTIKKELILILIGFLYLISFSIVDDKDFIYSHVTYYYYVLTETIFNGLIALTIYLFFLERLSKKIIVQAIVIGFFMSILNFFEILHFYLNQFKLYPSFLINETKEVPSSQYIRIILMLSVYILYLINILIITNKKYKLFYAFFITGYLIFFMFGHILMLGYYKEYRKEEMNHIEVILHNIENNNKICNYIKAQCFIVENENIEDINVTIKTRNAKNKILKNNINEELKKEIKKFIDSKENSYINLETSLVVESFKYGFLKLSSFETVVIVDTKSLNRGTSLYVNIFNTLNLIFILMWGYGSVFIYKKHQFKE